MARISAPASPSSQNREGQRIARLFRQYRTLGDDRACDLPAILAQDDLELHDSEHLDPGYAACLLRNPYGGQGGVVVLAPGQDDGRRRFSIAHELGHYHIPSHKKQKAEGFCADPDMRARSHDARKAEWEANDFAAELLMPMRLFAADVRSREISFATVYDLASPGMYNVSVTAAAWRLVQATRERCALVVSIGGRVEWVAKSESFRMWLADRSQQVHSDTLAASVFRNEGGSDRPSPVPVLAWVEDSNPPAGEFFESTHAIPRLNQVLSLLWQVEGDEEEAD